MLGIRAAWMTWRHRDDDGDGGDDTGGWPGARAATVSAGTVANGGDNIG
jgi:cadmium resistance protein CadD (predicted permease)